MTTQNTPWRGPDLDECKKAFIHAFVEFDLIIASCGPGDIHAPVTWMKEAGHPIVTPRARITMAAMLPKLEGYELVDTQETSTEFIRRYRKIEVQDGLSS